MARPELLRMLARLLEEAKITLEEAAAVLRAFDAGTLTAVDLPLPAGEAMPEVTAAVAAEAFRRLAARPSVQRAGRVVLDRQTITIPSERGRIQISAEIVADFEEARRLGAERTAARRAAKAAAEIVAEKGAQEAVVGAGQAARVQVAAWQRAEAERIRDHILEQATLGKGSALSADDLREVEAVVREQMAYLRGFSEEIAARQAVGRPISEKAIAARLRMYDGAAQGQFWTRKEAREDEPGYVYDYVSRDTTGTCDRCLDADRSGPYLAGQGPIPGVVCRGRGLCHCERRRRWAPEEYRRLTGRAA